ncbi:MAG: 50S ribosomal protein L29 [Candidatus Dojkabacteria bacterium]|nr:50S ribosomal protein L29 [Candidatus Dojkabacteria bacterium]
MTTSKYRKLTIGELKAELAKARQHIAELRYNVRSRKEKDYSQIKESKRDIAIMLTVLKEKMKAGERDTGGTKRHTKNGRTKKTSDKGEKGKTGSENAQEDKQDQKQTLTKKSKDDK